MHYFDTNELSHLYIPLDTSHKGQNGKLLLIGGSQLFHAASLWALEISSRIVDMVFYASIPENNAIVEKLKEQWRGGIVIPRDRIEEYIIESHCVLIGPGMVRSDRFEKHKTFQNITDILALPDEAEQTFYLTKYLLEKYPDKKWVIDAGALQMMEPSWIPRNNCILTPHIQEFERLFHLEPSSMNVCDMSQKYHCVILLKRHIDTVASPADCVLIEGGNAGMTKGGTGDVLAGLIAALACKNDLFLAAKAGSYFNKKAGEVLYQKVGLYFNASDLAHAIPAVMGEIMKLHRHQ
ncbi:MAG TPA: NAD(P)H-hydrate dehydratase [Patescibacteria group bacterium]|nr:NAD(P)H-hydrate dehydratase [Patescibacteria group bacterium]